MEMEDEALDTAEVVAAVAVGTLVAWGLTELVVGVGARVVRGLTKLISSTGSEMELDTGDSTLEMILEANGRRDHFAKVFEIESDCEPAVNLIKGKTHTKKTSMKEKVEECKKMLKRMTGCTLEHIGNKANKVADETANLGRDQDEEFVPFSSPPDQKIESLCVADVKSAKSV